MRTIRVLEDVVLLATSPSSPRHRSFELSHPIDQDCDRSWSEELRSSTPLCSQDNEKDMAADEIRQEVVEQDQEEADEVDDSGEREQRGEKRQHQDRGINSGNQHSESSSHGHDTNDDDDEDDEEDENPQPAKKRRLSRVSPDMPPTPPLETEPCRGQPHSATPSSTTQLEIGDAQSQTDLAHPPTSVNNDHHCTAPSSRSPSDLESASAADYQEWPFQGFLKRVTIGDRMIYNVEIFVVTCP